MKKIDKPKLIKNALFSEKKNESDNAGALLMTNWPFVGLRNITGCRKKSAVTSKVKKNVKKI